MRICHIVSDDYSSYNSSHFRVTIIMNTLKRDHEVFVAPIQEWAKGRGNPFFTLSTTCDIAIIQRVLLVEALDSIEVMRKCGVKVLVDFDDSYDKIRKDNAAYPFWGEGVYKVGDKTIKMDIHPLDQFKTVLMAVDGFIAPSKKLIDDWSHLAKGWYIPNYLSHYMYAVKSESFFTQNQLPIIGWGGSLSHVYSFTESGVIEALRRISREGIAQLAIFGDKRVVEELSISNTIYLPYCRFYDWPQRLSRIDIGIAPLAGAYDCRRSRLKVAEYHMLGIPCVHTDEAPYDHTVDAGLKVNQGQDAMEASPEAWYRALKRVAGNLEQERMTATESVESAMDCYDVEENVGEIEAVFTEIINE